MLKDAVSPLIRFRGPVVPAMALPSHFCLVSYTVGQLNFPTIYNPSARVLLGWVCGHLTARILTPSFIESRQHRVFLDNQLTGAQMFAARCSGRLDAVLSSQALSLSKV